MMKKNLLIVAIFSIFLMLVSCSGGNGGSSYGSYETPGSLAKKKQTEIMECFINKDKEGLKALFSEYILSSDHNIDAKIEQAFDFIDGEIVSYDEPFGDAVGSYEKKSYGADTSNIITDRGTEYSIGFKGWLTYEKEPDKVGVIMIGIRNESLYNELFEKGVINIKEECDFNIGEE